MKKIIIFSILLLISCVYAEIPLEPFFRKYPGPIYQDLVIKNEIYPIGSDFCDSRYELIKPILDQYPGDFSVFDLGAAQGYFSFRIAADYQKSACIMVEDNNTECDARHGDMLYDLCLQNQHLNNIFYLKKRMNLSDLSFLNQKEHFDVILAFLVVHLMHESLQEQVKILQTLLDLGDNVILEISNDVGFIHTSYVEYLSESLDCQVLGEVKRHKNPYSQSTGKLFWFKRKGSEIPSRRDSPIQKETFIKLGGVYPLPFDHLP